MNLKKKLLKEANMKINMKISMKRRKLGLVIARGNQRGMQKGKGKWLRRRKLEARKIRRGIMERKRLRCFWELRKT